MYNPNYHSFQDKTIIISGSSKGIGKALARELGMMGSRIVLNGTTAETLDATCRELQALGIDTLAVNGNVADINDCNRTAEAAINKFGCIDVLIANAGITAQGSLEESDPAVFRQLMEVNYLGVVYMIKACLPALKKSNGSILITGSAGGLRGMPGAAAYSASKMALTALADALKIELFGTGVGTGIAYVGFTENDAGKTMLDCNGQQVIKSKVARGKIASQQDVAAQMIEMIQDRKFKKVFSVFGKLNAAAVRFAPWLGNIILKEHYLKALSPRP
jgi:NAD(P)-dependent dehydrogenase (short-subunit alcohol dehydrogenase family)